MKILPYTDRAGNTVESKRRVVTPAVTLTIEQRYTSGWEVRWTQAGKAHYYVLNTPDAGRAAKLAFSKWQQVQRGETPVSGVLTIGKIIERYREVQAGKIADRSITEAVNRLYKLMRESLDLKTNQAVDRLPATVLDGQLIDRFFSKRLDGYSAGKELEARKRGANSLLADARMVFNRRLLALGVYPGLPDIRSFTDYPPLKEMPVTYDYGKTEQWVQRIFTELPNLKESDPAAYLLFRLAAGCGLRMQEAMQARKEWITKLGDRLVIHVQATDDWVPKGRKDRRVPLPEDIYADLLTMSDDSEYVVPAATANERSKGVSRRLSKWFNDLGWPFEKKAHELRKWFGAQVATQTKSLFAAQRLLGHASAKTTDNYYADLVDMPDVHINMGGKTELSDGNRQETEIAYNKVANK